MSDSTESVGASTARIQNLPQPDLTRDDRAREAARMGDAETARQFFNENRDDPLAVEALDRELVKSGHYSLVTQLADERRAQASQTEQAAPTGQATPTGETTSSPDATPSLSELAAIRTRLQAIAGAGSGRSVTDGFQPGSDAQRAAYDNAYAQARQTRSEEDARAAATEVAQIVASREYIESSVLPNVFGQARTERVRTAMNNALLSTDAYFRESIPELMPNGYQRLNSDQLRSLGVQPEMLDNQASGYFAGIYSAGENRYVLANRGTRGDSDAVGWHNNFSQFFGRPAAQYQNAIDAARTLDRVARARGFDVSFTGHSLGGGLASAQAVATGRQAMVFNSAAIRFETMQNAQVDISRSEFDRRVASNIRAYSVEGDVLTMAQDWRGVLTGGIRVGSAVTDIGPPSGVETPGESGLRQLQDPRTLRDMIGSDGLLAFVPPEIMNMPWRQAFAEIDAGPHSPANTTLSPGAVRYGRFQDFPMQEFFRGGPNLAVDPHVALDPVGRHSMGAVLGGIAASGRNLVIRF